MIIFAWEVLYALKMAPALPNMLLTILAWAHYFFIEIIGQLLWEDTISKYQIIIGKINLSQLIVLLLYHYDKTPI